MVEETLESSVEPMTARKYAAIQLRVPDSGDPELDAVILKARQMDCAAAALHGLVACATWNDGVSFDQQEVARCAYRVADAMLAEGRKRRPATARPGGEGGEDE